jgi:hypothetical protein
MNEFTPERALVKPMRDSVAEANENTLLERLILHFARFGIEPLILRDPKELIK